MFSKMLGRKGEGDLVGYVATTGSLVSTNKFVLTTSSTYHGESGIMKASGIIQKVGASTKGPFRHVVRRGVKFGTVTVREFASDIGGSVSSAGPSIGLGTSLKNVEELEIEEYERKERGKHGRSLTPLEFWLPPSVRLRRLQLAGIQKAVIDLEERQEEMLRRYRAAAMLDNTSIKLLELDAENYSNVLANIRKAQMLQQQRLMIMGSSQRPGIISSSQQCRSQFSHTQHLRHRSLPQLRQRQGTPLPRSRLRREQRGSTSNSTSSPYIFNSTRKKHQEDCMKQRPSRSQLKHQNQSNSPLQNAPQHQGVSADIFEKLSGNIGISDKTLLNGNRYHQRQGTPVSSQRQASSSLFRPRTALGRLEVRQNGKKLSAPFVEGTSNSSSRRPMSSSTNRRGVGWGSNGIATVGGSWRLSKGIATRRVSGRKKMKKSESGGDVKLSRFRKVTEQNIKHRNDRKKDSSA